MSPSQDPTGQLLTDLLLAWRRVYPRRASGGFWALVGFSYQAGTFLERHFRRVADSGMEPGEAASMEDLSDILDPHEGKLTIIQVKRTLNRSSLAEALHETYLITSLCRQVTPKLLPHLRFQITCSVNQHKGGLNLDLSDVVGAGGDPACWAAMLAQFDAMPIVEAPDPIDRLHAYFWNSGIEDPTALIERCQGALLEYFDVRGIRQPSALGRRLWTLFVHAERRADRSSFGTLLTHPDVAPITDIQSCRDVLVGGVPQLAHLRAGYFRHRPRVFPQIWKDFSVWLAALDSGNARADRVEARVPVFWIGGRSGEGKSILLLQLVQHRIQAELGLPLLHSTPRELPRVFREATDPRSYGESGPTRLFTVIDDPYDIRDRDAWDEAIRDALSTRSPRIAVLACGPTEQAEQFIGRLRGQFKVTLTKVPFLQRPELKEFRDWYQLRTGADRDLGELSKGNILLVQAMFELEQAMSLGDFARRFASRLDRANLIQPARAILAVNALYMDAPLEILETAKQRYSLERLCQKDQLHFRITEDCSTGAEGVRLIHPHLAWLLFVEWVDPALTLAQAWAIELASVLEILQDRADNQLANRILYELLNTTRATSQSQPPDWAQPVANRRELIREIYRLHVRERGRSLPDHELAGWLNIVRQIPDIGLWPNPIDAASLVLQNPATARTQNAAVAGLLWMLADKSDKQEADSMRARVRAYFEHFPDNPGVPSTLRRLLSQETATTEVAVIAMDWLRSRESHPQAYEVILPLLSAQPRNADFRRLAEGWIRCHRGNPRSYDVMSRLITGYPDDPKWRDLALDLVRHNARDEHIDGLIRTLTATHGSDPEVQSFAFTWLRENVGHPRHYDVLACVVAATHGDSRFQNLALDWLTLNQEHRFCFHVLSSVLAAHKGDSATRDFALTWLASHLDESETHRVAPSLIAAHPNDDRVRDFMIAWLCRTKKFKGAHQLIQALVAAHKGDTVVRDFAINWMTKQSDTQLDQIIRSLVAAHEGDESVRDLAMGWLERVNHHPQAYQVLASLVAAHPDDAAVRGTAERWLDENTDGPHFDEILRVLISRSFGDVAWLKRGEDRLSEPNCSSPETYVALLLTAGNAANPYIDKALDYLDGPETPKRKDYVRLNLSRALTHNPGRVVQYLQSARSDSSKAAVCRALVSGWMHLPHTIPSGLEDIFRRVDRRYQHMILQEGVVGRLASAEFESALAEWLYSSEGTSESQDIIALLAEYRPCLPSGDDSSTSITQE